jgi:hypothetical protein
LEQALTECQTEVMRLRGIGATEKITYVEDTLKVLLYIIRLINSIWK